jgi:L-cysteine:1D-myo-inositol 2-amino-2-deoxy-alpha-D-glucopyranoside ligase
MLRYSAERGGDPDRPGKRNRLDPMLWRGERPGEPSWPGPRGIAGRPGWHIECATIALETIGMGFDVQGGGSDLVFPHHEFSAVHAEALTATKPFARAYVHAAMIGLDGEKMSKSRGNLVFVSKLRGEGVDPMAIRLALLVGHYRTDRAWTPDLLATAEQRLDTWRRAVARDAGAPAAPVLQGLRERLADDLDSPGAIALVDDWAARTLAPGPDDDPDDGAPRVVADAVDALLGIALDPALDRPVPRSR